MLEDLSKALRDSNNIRYKNEILNELVMKDIGRKLPFFVINERLEGSSHLDAMKTISLIDILEYAEQQKLITIHRENFKE